MNFWLKGNVTIPARPHTVGGLIGWARGVNRALTELRDRKIQASVAIKNRKPVSHPWRVTCNNSDPASWDVVGDTVYGQGDPIVVADANVVGDVGYVVLKITRDEDNREMTAAEVEFAESITDSDYTYQYRVLAKVDKEGPPKVLQYQFEEIRIFEDMAVVNGEFRLVGLEMSHRNYYELP